MAPKALEITQGKRGGVHSLGFRGKRSLRKADGGEGGKPSGGPWEAREGAEDCGEFPRSGAGIHPPVSIDLLLPGWRRRKEEEA